MDYSKHIMGMIRETDVNNVCRFFEDSMNADDQARFSWERIRRTLLNEKLNSTQQTNGDAEAK